MLEAADLLKEKGIDVSVINVNKIKPLNKKSIIKIVKSFKQIITVEEHNINGGMGSLISDILVQENLNIKLFKIGLKDCFAKGYGTQQDLQIANNLDRKSISHVILEKIKS